MGYLSHSWWFWGGEKLSLRNFFEEKKKKRRNDGCRGCGRGTSQGGEGGGT